MKSDDQNIKWLESPELGLAEKLYLPLVVQGLSTTIRHFAAAISGRAVTVSYPEEEPQIDNPEIYRGVHRLNKDEAGPGEMCGLFPLRDGLPGTLH